MEPDVPDWERLKTIRLSMTRSVNCFPTNIWHAAAAGGCGLSTAASRSVGDRAEAAYTAIVALEQKVTTTGATASEL